MYGKYKHSVDPKGRLFVPSKLREELGEAFYVTLGLDHCLSVYTEAGWQAILDKYNVKTTFFMTGGWIESYPEDVKKIAAAGHDLGNHSENHKQMSQLSSDECLAEIQKPHDKVKELTGTEMTLFRPPYGDYNNTLIESANTLGYHVVQWSVDSLDWKDYGADSIVDTILNHKALGDGAIILMHNGAKYTKDALERVITGLQDKGYEIVPISQLIYTEKYHMDNTGRQFKDE